MADILYCFLIGFKHPHEHDQEEQAENDERRQRINADAGYFFEVVYEFHFSLIYMVYRVAVCAFGAALISLPMRCR